MLLVRYITRVARPLVLATVVASLTYLLSFPSISILLFSSYVGITFIAAISLVEYLVSHLRNTDTYYQLLRFTIIAIVIPILLISIFAFPHVYLFFSALPLLLSGPLLHVTTTLFAFEYILARDSRIPDRSDLSLIRILSNPRRGIARLRVLLEPNTHRARNELELRPNVAAADNSLQVGIDELATRYMDVLTSFPKEAIIDDAALYKKQFDRLRADRLREGLPTFNEEIVAGLRKEAYECALQEAQSLAAAYQETLSSAEQRQCYENYRKVALRLSLYATCPVSMEDIHSGRPEDFSIVEKRYTAPVYIKKDDGTFEAAEPGRTAVYAVTGKTAVYQTDTFNRILDNRDEALDPLDRDQFFNSSTYPNTEKKGSPNYRASHGASYPTKYVVYAYSQNHGNGLSLELCEAMEAFLDPTLEECKKAALQKTQAPAKIKAPTEEKMPQPLKKQKGTSVVGLSPNSMFSRRTTSSRRPSSSRTIYHNDDTTDTYTAAIAAGVPLEEIMANLAHDYRFQN